ncbi:MAG: SDR family oxidoreductase [Spirochaetales bacterium]|nr:SDR family oxidoreductase [Spirochaetales bacterium]
MVTIDLSDKTALVTGGAGGIGKACAETLSRAGAAVAVADIDIGGAQKTAASLANGKAFGCDMGNPASIRELCSSLSSWFGTPDILVHCAGLISYRKGLQAVDLEQWDTVLDVNLRGAFLLCRELLEPMKKKGWGKIVHFSSLAARVGGIEAGVHYATSKAGLIGLVRTMAKEAAPHGINVNAVAPGIIATKPVLAQIEDHKSDYEQSIPMRRVGLPQDVADTVLFLCSPLSDYITGITVDINGGMYMG